MNEKQHLPLHNIEVEQGLIGIIMHDNRLLTTACADLEPEHFHEDFLGDVFSTCRAIVSRGDTASPVTLAAHYQTSEAAKSLGGPLWFARLYGGAAAAISAPHYARIIRDLYIRRRAVEEAERAISEIAQLPIDEQGADYAAAMAQRISELAAMGFGRKSRFGFGESLAATIDHIAMAYQYDGRRPDAVMTGIKALDDHIGGFIQGDLVIIAGRPGTGKTALGIELCRRSGERGQPAVFFSGEMTNWQLTVRILSAAVTRHNIHYSRMMWGRFSEQEFEAIAEKARDIQAWPLTIIDQDRMSLAQIRAEIARAKAVRPDLKLAVVDYLGLIRADGAARSRTEEVGAITVELKAIARQFGVVMVVLAQLSRAVEARENKRPHLADLRESGSIEQDADVVLFPFREEYYLARDEPRPNTDEHLEWQDAMTKAAGQMDIIIDKFRQGRTGMVRVKADMALNRIEDIEETTMEMFT